jgi:hypothetical protein
VGTLVSQIIFFVMIYIAAQKWYRIPYQLNRITGILIAGILLTITGFFLNDMQIGIRLVLKTLLLLSYPFLLYLFQFYSPQEMVQIRKIIHTWKDTSRLISNLKRLFLNK